MTGTNLLNETYEMMELYDKHPNDITFIGSNRVTKDGLRYYTSWAKFIVMADREYDAGYGGSFVALDLIIEFNDGSKLYRHEYDGAENWCYSSPCITPATETLIEMQSPFAFYDNIKEAHKEGYWDEHKEHLCPQDGCNNLKGSMDEMCYTCYAPIRAKKLEERRKSILTIKHKPMKVMFDGINIAQRLKKVLDEGDEEE